MKITLALISLLLLGASSTLTVTATVPDPAGPPPSVTVDDGVPTTYTYWTPWLDSVRVERVGDAVEITW
jgi:hypothetical protein